MFNFDGGAQHTCSGEESSWVEQLLEQGVTVGAVGRQQTEMHSDPQQNRQVDTFVRRMIAAGLLQIRVAPPRADILIPGASYRAVIHTTLGAMVFELLPEEAPRTVANFVHLARLGHYNGVLLRRAHPGALVEMGAVLSNDRGPAYALSREATPRVHERGSLSMDIARHASRFVICRRSWPDLDGHEAVFGEMIGGWDVLDLLLNDDSVVQVEIQPADAQY